MIEMPRTTSAHGFAFDLRSVVRVVFGPITRLPFVGCWIVLGLASASSALAQETRSPLDEDGRIVDFQRDILPILRDRCLECHNEEDAKNDYRVDVADEFLIYVEPEDVESSSIFVDYMTTDDPDLMMPPASHGGPLSPAELSLIRTWISEGADWPEDIVIRPIGAQADGVEEESNPAVAPTSLVGRVWTFQGFLHPATVHFPIALLLIGALFVALGWKWPAVGLQVPMACLILGAASSIAATAMGWSFAVQQGYGGWTKFDLDSEVFWHRWTGLLVTILSTLFALVAVVAVSRKREGLNKVWKGGLIAVAALVGAVGHQGGEMTYGKDFYPKALRILLGTPEVEAETESVEERMAVRSRNDAIREIEAFPSRETNTMNDQVAKQ